LSSFVGNMRLQGYSDVSFGTPLQEKLPEGGLQASKYSFQIADLHLFFTSRLSPEWSFLSELLITSDFSNEFASELDRLLIQYSPNKHLRVGFGKFNTGIGYYPDEFHRAKFFQVASGRPIMFSDEDNGGILPLHQIGITAQGAIPSGSFGLHYLGEVSNGRSYREGSAEIQNWADSNNLKAVNVGLFARPDFVQGLEVGFSVYRDTLDPVAGDVRETVTAAHAVFVRPNFEWLNEVLVLKHVTDATEATATTKSFYSQVSKRFGTVRPYFRWDYQDVPDNDPVFTIGDTVHPEGLRKVASVGVHFGIGNFAVLKTQYDRALQYGEWANGAHAQLAFAF
jgi:hypothetical protein